MKKLEGGKMSTNQSDFPNLPKLYSKEEIIKLLLSEEIILNIISDWWEKEKKGKTLSDLASAISQKLQEVFE